MLKEFITTFIINASHLLIRWGILFFIEISFWILFLTLHKNQNYICYSFKLFIELFRKINIFSKWNKAESCGCTFELTWTEGSSKFFWFLFDWRPSVCKRSYIFHFSRATWPVLTCRKVSLVDFKFVKRKGHALI